MDLVNLLIYKYITTNKHRISKSNTYFCSPCKKEIYEIFRCMLHALEQQLIDFT